MRAPLQTIEEIFHAALDREPDEVGTFLDDACQGDESLRRTVESLLTSHHQAGSFIEISPSSLTAKIIEKGQADLLVGQTIGHYQISKRIGSGGMGEVYLATDLTAGRKAALKLLPLRFTDDAERLKRFKQEARTVVGLNHPNILTVYEIGEDRSTHYIASELIEGETLRQRLQRGRMEVNESVNVAIQIASALAAAHEAGIVHRDIKPENIMLRSDGYVKVLDFGIAKLAEHEAPAFPPRDEAPSQVETNLGSILGTVRYMSPEQALGAQVDQRTDIWSIGVVLYEMVTGSVPFSSDAPREAGPAIPETQPPQRLHQIAKTPEQLQQIISKTLNHEPAKRYHNVRELLAALESLRRALAFKAELKRSTAAPAWLRRVKSPIGLALLFLATALVLALPFFWPQNAKLNSPEKSIAVLPFASFSADKENAFFAEGVQDDILTALAKVADLKVISRTSVESYAAGPPRNLAEIGRELGVANILEGSVRRANGKVRVTAQLIDTRSNTHLWAETYDRDLTDVFAIQSEIARQIASALKARLAPEEKTVLASRPTSNPEAYVLYLTARGMADRIEAEKILMQAIALDPGFALAYAQASILNNGATEDKQMRRAKARAQAEEAVRLAPGLGEAHLALGLTLYWGEKKYDAALKEFEIAAASLPNDADVLVHVGGIYRRQGRWKEAITVFERACSLDPRNRSVAFLTGNHHLFLRDWTGAAAGYHRALEISPDFVFPKIGLAYVELFRNADPAAGRKILQAIPAQQQSQGPVMVARWDLAMLERDYVAAEKILNETSSKEFLQEGDTPRESYQGRLALALGDIESAQRYFAAARLLSEKRVRDDPGNPENHRRLGLVLGYMQQKEDAVRESLRAIELEPESQNAFHGSINAANLALVYALTGEPDKALPIVERLISIPGPVQWPYFPNNITLADLRLRPEWDSLRGNPRFQKIIAGPEPETRLSVP